MNCACHRERDSVRFFSRVRQVRASAAMPGAATVALLLRYRRSFRTPLVVDAIGKLPAPLFNKPERSPEDLCEEHGCMIGSQQLQFHECRPAKTALSFWW